MFYNEASRSHGEHWLRTLAQADAGRGVIVPRDARSVEESSKLVLAHVMDDLLDDLEVAVATFNSYRAGRGHVSLVCARQDGVCLGPVIEITLMLGGFQLRVTRDGPTLAVIATARRVQQIRSWAVRRVTPEPDGMGSVLWRVTPCGGGDASLVERPTVVKYLLADLVRLAV